MKLMDLTHGVLRYSYYCNVPFDSQDNLSNPGKQKSIACLSKLLPRKFLPILFGRKVFPDTLVTPKVLRSIFWITVFFALGLSNSLYGQISFVAANSGTTNTTSLVINKPAGLQTGDLMIANIVQSDDNSSTLSNATSSGWTLIDGREFGNSGSDRWWGTILYKSATASDVAATSFTFTIDSDIDGTGEGALGGIIAYRGVSLTGGVTESGAPGGPFDLDPGIINGIATDASLTAASITTATANAYVVMLGLVGNNQGLSAWSTATSPGTLTENQDVNLNAPGGGSADLAIGAASANKPAAGSTGAGSATIGGSAANGSILIALRGCTPPSVQPIGGGPAVICIGASPPAFTNATPGGVWSVINGTGSATIAQTGIATGVTNGTVTIVYTVTENGCSGSATKAMNVGPPAQPSVISGPTGVCSNAMGIAYSVTNVPGTTYTWSITGAGWSIASGQGTSSITLDAGSTFPQTLTVTPSNACGNGTPRTLVINNSGANPTYCTSCTSCTEPIGDNPDVQASCADLKIAFVIDESTSITSPVNYEPDVEAGVMAFVNTLSCTGVQLAVVEFNNQARFVLDTATWYHNVDNALVDAMQDYVDNVNNPLLLNNADYSPGVGTNYTNWHAAMLAVDHIPTPPDLVIFFTDGVPTKVYLTNPPPNYGTDGSQCGDTGAPQAAEYLNPAKVANKLKCEGVHMFMAGVGGVVGNEQYLQALSGTTAWQNGVNDITNSDYATGNYNQLALGLSTFVNELCPFESDVTSQDICPGGTNGSITITIPANLLPYNYQYYNNDNNDLLGSGNNINVTPLVITGLGVGNYRIEVEVTIPGSGCTRTEIFFETITASAVPVVASVTNTVQPTCANPNAGSATLTITAGEAPYMITLKKGGVTQPGYPVNGYMSNVYTATGLDAGSYTFELKDVNNCNTDIDAFTLNPPSRIFPLPTLVLNFPRTK